MEDDKELLGREWQNRSRKVYGSSNFKAKCLNLPTSPCGGGLWPSQVLGFCKPAIPHSKLQEIQECATSKILQQSHAPKSRKS